MWRFSNDALITQYEFLQPQLPPDPQSVRPVFTRNCVASNGLHFCGDDLYLERRLDGLVIDLHGHIYNQHDLSNPLSTFSIEGDGHMVAASIANYGFEKKHKAFIPVPDFISDESDTFLMQVRFGNSILRVRNLTTGLDCGCRRSGNEASTLCADIC